MCCICILYNDIAVEHSLGELRTVLGTCSPRYIFNGTFSRPYTLASLKLFLNFPENVGCSGENRNIYSGYHI